MSFVGTNNLYHSDLSEISMSFPWFIFAKTYSKIQSEFYQSLISFYLAMKSEIDIFQIMMMTRK